MVGASAFLTRVRRRQFNKALNIGFVADASIGGRRFRLLSVIDGFNRLSLATSADYSLSGKRFARGLDRLVKHHGAPRAIVSDDGTGFTSDGHASKAGKAYKSRSVVGASALRVRVRR